jgi:hypothetical protein
MISGCVCDLIKNPNHHQERDLLAFPRKLTPALTPSSQSAIALPPARWDLMPGLRSRHSVCRRHLQAGRAWRR